MYFTYIDESGDSGHYCISNTTHFILTAVTLHSSDWADYLDKMIKIKRKLCEKYNIKFDTEIHAAELINPRGKNSIYRSIGNRSIRVNLYRDFLKEVTRELPNLKVINVYCDKTNKEKGFDVEDTCWKYLLQRVNTYLEKEGKGNKKSLIFADQTNEKKVRSIMRKMRRYNYVPSQFESNSLKLEIKNIIEDPIMRDSNQSFFVQIADSISHALYRKIKINKGMKRYSVEKLFDLVDPILNKKAAFNCSQGIKRI